MMPAIGEEVARQELWHIDYANVFNYFRNVQKVLHVIK